MNLPIIIDNFGDLLIFGSVREAERYLEPIDVRNGEYIAYDAVGRLLNLLIIASRVEPVQISCAEEEPSHENELHQKLSSFLVEVGVDPIWVESASLAELVSYGLSKYPTQ